jgi:hypothetical protein
LPQRWLKKARMCLLTTGRRQTNWPRAENFRKMGCRSLAIQADVTDV